MRSSSFLVKALTTLAFSLLVITESFSQYHFTRHLTIADGLPSNSVHDIFRDSRGIYWIATEAGLCKYDGVTIKVYTTHDGLPGNRIWSITEDGDGNLWLACYGSGISRFDGHTFKNYSSANGLVNDNVRKIQYSLKSRGLFIGTVFGFSFFKDSVFTSFQDTSITDRNLLQVTDFIDCDSVVYLLTYYDSEQFIRFNPYTKEFGYLPANHRFHQKSFYSTSSFISSRYDTIIANQIEGVKIYTADSIIIRKDMAQVFDMAEDSKGEIWIAAWNDGNIPAMKGRGGIYRMKNHQTQFFNDYLNINSHLCWCLHYDEEENLLWIGTLDKGLYIYALSGAEYMPASAFNQAIPEIYDVISDLKGCMWVSAGDKITKDGINITSGKTDTIQNGYLSYNTRRYGYVNDPAGSYYKYSILRRQGLFWFKNPYLQNGRMMTPGSQFNPGRYKDIINARLTGFDRFYESDSGKIYVNSNLGIFQIDRDNSFRYKIFNIEGHAFFIEHDTICSMLQYYNLLRFSIPNADLIDAVNLRKNVTYSSFCDFFQDNDKIWIYNNTDGISCYHDGKTKRFDNLQKAIDLSFSSMTVDKPSNIIAGTNTGNIYILTTEADSLKVLYSLSQDDGIQGTDIRWVHTDRSHRLWFSTNKGLNMINLDSLYKSGKKEICWFNEENGFFDMQTFKAISDKEGEIIAVSKANMFRFDPDELTRQGETRHKISIDKIEINFRESELLSNTEADKWSGIPPSGLLLPYKENTLTFYFHMIQYSEPSKVQYSYKLEGANGSWSPYASWSKAVFTYLEHGRYVLRIRARLLSSPDNISEMEYSFRIKPPWWHTWWFYTLVILNALIITLFFLNRHINNIKRKSDIERRMTELKMEALRSQMNPHFIFNAFNSIQKYIMLKDSKSALEYMSDFASLIRKTLDNSTQDRIKLSEEIKYLNLYLNLEQKRVPNMRWEIELNESVTDEEILLPPMIIQPFVENAILHGIRHSENDGLVILRMDLSNDGTTLICIIEDNGIGRVKSAEMNRNRISAHKSHGTPNTLERIKILGCSCKYTDLTDIDGSPVGTRVELNICLG